MSDCNWLGMDVFGTQVLAPGPSDLPSTVLSTVSASIEQVVSLQVDTTDPVNVPMAGTTPLKVSITRLKKNHSLLVSLNLTGIAVGSAETAILHFRTQVGGHSIATQTADLSDVLLVTSSRVHPGSSTPQPRFLGFYSILVPPEVLPSDGALEFLVQVSVETSSPFPRLDFDPKQDALVVQEIGPLAL